MIRAVAQHVFLLMTFQHDLTGLQPRSARLLVFIVTLATLAALARYGIASAMMTLTVILFLYSVGLKRSAVAVGLLSMTVGGVLLCIQLITDTTSSAIDIITDGWQLLAIWFCITEERRSKPRL